GHSRQKSPRRSAKIDLAALRARVNTARVSPLTNSFFRRALLAVTCLSGGLTLGCANRNGDWQDTGYPNAPARTIIAEPGGYEDVYVADQQYQQQVVDGRQVVGYDTLSDGTQVEVVQYVHTYE